MARDSQRQKVYDAERLTWNAEGGDGLTSEGWPKDFDTIKEVQAFVNRVTKSTFWKTSGGRRFVHARPVPNRSYARGWASKIEIPEWAYSKPVVLHELAHSYSMHTMSDIAAHGPEFVLIFRRLIEQELGADHRRRFDLNAEALKVSWSARNIASTFEIRG